MQTIITKDGKRQWTPLPGRKAQAIKSKLESKIVSIVQASKGKNTKGYTRTSCMVNIPVTICKLAGIEAGSLVLWELSKYEHNVFVMRVLEAEPEIGDSA